MRLIPIDRFGKPLATMPPLGEEAAEVCRLQIKVYAESGYTPPWTAYFARSGPACVGACGFRGAPHDGRVELYCVVFEGYEGHGLATQMARALVELAQRADPSVEIVAQAQNHQGAWPSVLRKVGFEVAGSLPQQADGMRWEWRLPPLARAIAHEVAAQDGLFPMLVAKVG